MVGDANDLIARNVLVSQRPRFDVRGAPTTETVVTYYVGNHGPFQDVYAPGDYTTDKAKAKIDERINGLRTLVTGTY